jgi:hypothetical protein
LQNQHYIQAIKRAFAAAFDAAPLPVFPERRMSMWDKDHEAIVRIFKNVTWPDLSPEAMEYSYDISPLIDWPRHFPQLWAYYLPSFLFYILDNRETDFYLPTLMNTLAVDDISTYPPDRLEFLTESKKHAIALFLKLLLEEEDTYDQLAIERIRPSFDQYWSKYLDKT